MSCYIKDSFDMPHDVGSVAKVTRLDAVYVRPNLFGGLDACIFMDASNTPAEVIPDVRIGVEDPGILRMIGADAAGSCYPGMDDVVLVCERIGEFLCWYKVVYSYETDNKTDD